jgi:hypothetical protein
MYPFPHPTLTKIDGKPNAVLIKLLTKKVYVNAKSVHSVHGGGLNGHLGLAMPVAAYVIRAGANFVEPPHPGPLPIHDVNAISAQITVANRAYDLSMTEFQTCQNVKENLKQQILEAVANIYLQDLEDDVFGYADITITQIIAHLGTTYGQLNANYLEANRQKLTDQWNPDEPFENIWKHIRIIRAVATAGCEAISDNVTIELTLSALTKAGVYDHAIENWYNKPEDEQTWETCLLHFNKHEKQRLRKLTAKATGYHGANKATAITPPTAAIISPPANALAVGQPAAPHGYSSNSIDLFYWWSHGLSKNPEHTSGTCNSKGEGHQDDATLDNRKAESTKLTSAGQANNVKSISHLDRGEGSQQQ